MTTYVLPEDRLRYRPLVRMRRASFTVMLLSLAIMGVAFTVGLTHVTVIGPAMTAAFVGLMTLLGGGLLHHYYQYREESVLGPIMDHINLLVDAELKVQYPGPILAPSLDDALRLSWYIRDIVRQIAAELSAPQRHIRLSGHWNYDS